MLEIKQITFDILEWKWKTSVNKVYNSKQTTYFNKLAINENIFMHLNEPQIKSTEININNSSMINFPILYKSNAEIMGNNELRIWNLTQLTRKHCNEKLINYASNGDFIVRPSESKPGAISLSVRSGEDVIHYLIFYINRFYTIGKRKFVLFENLIKFYKKYAIYISTEGKKTILNRELMYL